MSSLSTLDRDLCSILAEMRSDKITQRQKAFEKLELILVNREEDILRYMAEGKFDTNWHDLLEAAHHGTQKQNRKMIEPNATAGASAESKSYIYIKVIQKVVDLAMNRSQPQIKFSELIKRFVDVLGDPAMLQYFGVCYLQVLQKHVLNSKWDLTVITYDEWISILDRCFELYDDGRVAKQNVVSCLSLAVRKSLENCSVQSHFVKFLGRLAKMINESERGKMQNELIRIGYVCVSSLAVDYRFEICGFTEQISQRVVKAYETRMDEEIKSVLFKLMHLTVLVHSPEKSFSEWRSNQNLFHAADLSEYYKCLRNFYFVIGSELKAHASAAYNAVGGREVPFVEGFIDLAARLCYVMFWNDDVWSQTGTDNEVSMKRLKRANRLQGLMDLVEENSAQPNWRWLIILAEIIKRCPAVLCEDDYQPMLNLLSSVQPKLSLSSQLEAFRTCCCALLCFEQEDRFRNSTIINTAFCTESWHKIIEGSFRCCTSNNKSAADNHLILQLLISNRMYPSITFLNGILQAFYTYSIERTNTNIGTIKTILEVVPLEAIGTVQEVVEKLLNYLFPKSRESLAKGILHNKEILDMKLLANISVHCSVTKHHTNDDKNVNNSGATQIESERKYIETERIIREVEEDILLKSVEKILAIRTLNAQNLDATSTKIMYNIHEKNFEMLCTSLNFEKHTLPADKDFLGKGLNQLIGDVELYVAILNELLSHHALGRDSFEKCLITKKIAFKVQELELGFEKLGTLTAVELNGMSSRLLRIFRGPYDGRINELLKGSNFTSLFSWIFKNVRNGPDKDSKTVEALKYEALTREQSNLHNLLLIMAHYMQYNGVNTNEVKAFLDQVQFNVNSSLDLFHIFGLCKVLLQQRSTFFCAEWILSYIKDICVSHHTNNAMTEAIVDLYSELVVFVSPHDSLYNDINMVLLSFIRKANKRNYSVGLQRKIYDQVKYLLKAYPDYYESHEQYYMKMISLIGAPHFAIKASAVENLLCLFDDSWAYSADTANADFYRFQLKLYNAVPFELDDLLRKDEKESLLSAFLQLICGTICKSYCLRKRAILNLVEQTFLNNLPQYKIHTLTKLLRTATNIDSAHLIQENMEEILDMWISKGYKLASFPWYFTQCGSLDEFIKNHQYDIAFAIVSNRPADLQQFCDIIKRSQADVIKMYGVAQFMENGRLQVLAVPMSWIKKGFLMWPKSLSNEKIDKMRTEGTVFNGSTKPIPVIVTRKFRSFQAAEASVEELSKKDVSDFEAKKKQLKSAKKKKLAEKRNDYNVLCEAIVDKENQACSSGSVPIVPMPESSIAPPEQVVRRSQPLQPLINIPLEVATPMNISQAFSQPASPLLAPLFHLSLPQSLSALPSVAQASSETAGAVQIVQELSTSNAVQEHLEHELVDCMPQQIQMKPLEITSSLPDNQSFAVNFPDENIQYEAYAGNLDVEGHGADQVEITTDLDVLIKQNIFDAVNVSMQSYLDKHIEKVVDRAVSAAVDKSFASNFARLAAMTEALNKTATKDDTIIEIRPPVDTENHVTDWNAELANDDLQMKYVISTRCIAFLIPKWANCDNMPENYIHIADRMQPSIRNHVDMKQLNLNDRSNQLLLQRLVEYLQDESLMADLFGREILVVENKCVLNAGNFTKCLDHFKTLLCTTSKQPLFTHLCSKYPSVVEQLLLHFKLKIYQSDVTEQKMIVLFQYSMLIDYLVDYFCQHRSAELKEYLARDICYFLSNTMVHSRSLQLPVLNCLMKFLSKVTPTCAEYVRPHLNFLTSSLLSVHDQSSSAKVAGKVVKILELIVLEHQTLFGDGIKKLNYFPDHGDFKHLREALEKLKESQFQLTLAEDIIRIIQLPQLKYGELTTLYRLLAIKKAELHDTLEELRSSNGFSESCESNAVLRLINTLLKEIQNSGNEKHTIEALRCLGEIGPVDLSTMLLKSDIETEMYQNLKDMDSAVEQFVRVMLAQLNELVVNRDLNVVQKAAAVSYHVLKNSDYRKLAVQLRTLYPYMTLAENDRPIFIRSLENTNLGSLLETISTATSYASFVLVLSSALLQLLQDTVIKALTDIETNFAAKLVPMLVQIVLCLKDGELNNNIESFVNHFFVKFADNLTPANCITKNLEVIHLMLAVVECVRMNNQNHPKHKINLHWLKIASASLYCQAYFKAIMYGELWCTGQRDEGVDNDAIKRDPQLMSIMKAAHLAVGVEDAAKAFLDPISSRSEYYQLERRHSQSLLYYDVASSSKSPFERSAYVGALKTSCFYGLANMVAGRDNVDFECAWRLADWNVALEDQMDQSKRNVDWQQVFDKQHYKALKCLELKDEIATDSAVLEARKAVAEMLKVVSMESTQNIYPYLSKLRQLQQIEDFMNVQFFRVIDGEIELLQKWDHHDKLPYSNFSFMEAILSQRVAILKTARVRAMRKWVPDALHQALFHLIHEARISGHSDVASANICAMSQQTLTENVKALVMLEDAQLNWANGDKFLSKRLVNEIVAGGKCKDLMVNAAAYRIYGTFLAETYAEDVHNLYKKFFKHSQTLVEEGLKQASQKDKVNAVDYQCKCLDGDRNFTILYTVAKYADREFVRLKKHFTSTEFKMKKTNLEQLKAELVMLEAEQAKLKESDKEKLTNLRRAKVSTKQNAARDEESINTMMSNMEDYLKLALFYYSAYTRKTSIESDLAVFRIVALWLGNHSEKIANIVSETLKAVPTYKFVPVLPQLAPRLDNRKDGVGRMVWETLERCAVDHPHHTLPHILAQVYAFADVEVKDVPKDDARLLGAQSLYNKLLKNKTISDIVDQTTEMNLAFIEMANKTLGGAKGFTDYKMISKDALKRCKELDKVHCSTVELKVQESGVYDGIIGVHKWDDQIHGVGGINAPKKLVCHCMDGQSRIQLLKGRDDMRQDAVMQQVFNILNVLLRNDKEAGKQKLTARTYKVVPLSKQSGILEWCSNTIPIGSWLIPAHSRYRPKDMSAMDARKAFAELAKSSLRTKQEKFHKICQHLSPVFQQFFFEKFLTSGMWFERRLAYTKSVAVSSIIGYILGIGDRHVQNILVDENTAEVIHIDFGIAFELGKNLPTPETIPFRLTRDIVAGMGISGIEGVFKKSCEKTLEILRNNHAPIMTILEVLLYDPLYTWNVLANKKAARKQIAELYGGEGGVHAEQKNAVNISAERALLRVSDKLNGKEDEKFTSVEGQVERLIFAASSNLNLCQLFQGWQPYL